ncbi:mitochondrial ribosomal protein S18C [Brevipalpus obovatus]|uniref:mitochondrial ribosomal protein S18C n=1 Tax=Brevipalpus obovatus TaxID=246614 RepID=UPI003D9EE59D
MWPIVRLGSRFLSRPTACSSIRNCSNKSDLPETPFEVSDKPLHDMDNPYCKEGIECILCRHNITVNYKNPRLISQFCSPITGLLYERHITGLCIGQHQALCKAVKKCHYLGLMMVGFKEPRFNKDPKLYDPLNPTRRHPF